jgi:hypothetical protein
MDALLGPVIGFETETTPTPTDNVKSDVAFLAALAASQLKLPHPFSLILVKINNIVLLFVIIILFIF